MKKTDLSKIKSDIFPRLNKEEIKLLNMADPEAVSKAMEKTSFDDIAEMVSRVYAMEFDQENPKGQMSDKDKAIMLAEKLRRIRAKNKANPMGKKDGGVVKKFNEGGDAKTDGKVPNKFKGFSKLPEEVQQKIDKDLASKYKKGGEVKKKSAIKKRIAIRGFGIAKRGY